MARTEPPRTGRLARGTITGIAAARIGMAQLGHRVRTPSAQAQADHEAAFAAASLGQVHRAQLAGHGTVAVKVQYPGIAATITSDMQLMRAALRALAHTDMPLPANTVVDS